MIIEVPTLVFIKNARPKKPHTYLYLKISKNNIKT